jgi:RNA polymerase sigma-70 factor (ECF subfamily)
MATDHDLPDDGFLREMLQRCAARDPIALEKLYRRSAPLLFATLVRTLKRRSVAEEALQDVFVSIWERAAQYSPARGRPLAWMVSIARYRAIDLQRHERFAPQLMPEPPDPSPADAVSQDPADLRPVNDARFDHCFGRLPELQRRCLELAFVGGNSHGDIARATGNPLGTVKSWIRRGLEAMRACLQS